LVLVFLCALVGMGVHYEANATNHWSYPTGDDFENAYAEQVGEQALVYGTVTQSRPDESTLVIESSSGADVKEFVVGGVDVGVQPGGVVQVYGTVRPEQKIAGESVVVVNRSGDSLAYKYGVSLVGAILLVVLFFRCWRVNWAEFAFEVR
jgi:hypothetical protein